MSQKEWIMESSGENYKKIFFRASFGLFIVGVVASFLSFNVFKVELQDISDNPVTANIVFISFIVILVERVLESINSSVRKPVRAEMEEIIQQEKDKLSLLMQNDPLSVEIVILERKIADLTKALIIFRNQTRIMLLSVSLILGGLLSAFGCLNILAPMIDQSLFISSESKIHRALFDGLMVLMAGWIVAGGSEGWNSVTHWVENNINPKKA